MIYILDGIIKFPANNDTHKFEELNVEADDENEQTEISRKLLKKKVNAILMC